ncbi:serine threonine-protein kinase ulk3 [Lynx pardinus]|uniref:non-specific serine/threonine protein kinase n=1 Tax=Lynx pardinus TaxID=191816 RepID=A0A485P9U4_LYNPA|nr:serine threonine-protein kinase ulk3 [Lynx pardinus]
MYCVAPLSTWPLRWCVSGSTTPVWTSGPWGSSCTVRTLSPALPRGLHPTSRVLTPGLSGPLLKGSKECDSAGPGTLLWGYLPKVGQARLDPIPSQPAICLPSTEALFGQPPFASRSFAELEEKIRSNRVIEDFFAHPWVDLEHVPSGESLARATALVVQAVKKDQDGDAAAALSLYCKALDFFVPALHYEVDAQRKEAIKAKVGQYVSRAEELKAIVSSSNQALLRQGTSARDLLREMARDKPRLLAALDVASAAMAKEEEAGGEQDALDLYQHGLGELLVLLAAEPPGRRRELLHAEVQNLMARAEYLKEQVKMRESRWAAESLDKEGLSESVRSSCTLQ